MRIIIALIGNISYFLAWYLMFRHNNISIKKMRRLVCAFAFVSFFCSLLLYALSDDTGPMIRSHDVNLICGIAFSGVPACLFLYIVLRIKAPDLSYIHLKARDYEIVKEISVYPKFSYAKQYLQCRDGRIILIAQHPIEKPHDLDMAVEPAEQYGDRVFLCQQLQIADSHKTLLERYQDLLKNVISIVFALLSVLYVYVLCHQVPYEFHSHEDPVMELFCCLFLFDFGACSQLLSVLTNNKAVKIFTLLFGGLIVFASLSGIVQELCLLLL